MGAAPGGSKHLPTESLGLKSITVQAFELLIHVQAEYECETKKSQVFAPPTASATKRKHRQ